VRRSVVARPERARRIPRVRTHPCGPTVVLMYHRVDRRAHDPLRLCVTPEHFAEQVAAIRQVADLVAPHQIFEPGSRPRVAITFDDGYLDNLEHAAPVLEAHDAPACIFATDHLGPDAAEYWWDQLDHLFLDGDAGVPYVELDLAHGTVRYDIRNEAGRIRTFSVLNNVFRDLAPDTRRGHLAVLHEQLGRTPVHCDAHRRLDRADLRALADGGLVEIGGHTAGHAALPLVDRATAAAEIAGNRATVAAATGRAPRLFAYPYGTYARRSATQVRRAGYELAFLARPGMIWALTNPMAVPRLPVHDWGAEQFLGELRGALGVG
jgi:peptidoglycan/xylan/chitin deacetylase (PgdA/CDA1 family)